MGLDAVRAQHAVIVRPSRRHNSGPVGWLIRPRLSFARYERSAEGYDPEEKRAELFHPDARFLLLRRQADPSSGAPGLGYCVFRFDTEETDAEEEGQDDLCAVAYWCVSAPLPGVGGEVHKNGDGALTTAIRG